MNRKQRRAIWVGVVLIVLMGLLPPWQRVYGRDGRVSASYSLLFDPPENAVIDTTRLLIQWFLVVGARVVTAKDHPLGEPGEWSRASQQVSWSERLEKVVRTFLLISLFGTAMKVSYDAIESQSLDPISVAVLMLGIGAFVAFCLWKYVWKSF